MKFENSLKAGTYEHPCPAELYVWDMDDGIDVERRYGHIRIDVGPAEIEEDLGLQDETFGARVSLRRQKYGGYSIEIEFARNMNRAGRRGKLKNELDLWSLDEHPDNWSDPSVILDRIDELGADEAAKRMEISRATLFRYKKELREKLQEQEKRGQS